MKKYINKFLSMRYWPEIVGLVSAVFLFCILVKLEVGREVVELVSSLGSQLLGVYLGLALTTFGVYHGLNIRKTYEDLASAPNVTASDKEKVQKFLGEITSSFTTTITIIAIGTTLGFLMYLFSILAKTNQFMDFANPNIINSLAVATIFGLITSSTLSVVETVRTILVLRD